MASVFGVDQGCKAGRFNFFFCICCVLLLGESRFRFAPRNTHACFRLWLWWGQAETAASPAPTPTESPAASESAETPAPSTFYSKKMPEKSKRKGAPILNLFKRDTGPQRATTLEEALAAEVI